MYELELQKSAKSWECSPLGALQLLLAFYKLPVYPKHNQKFWWVEIFQWFGPLTQSWSLASCSSCYTFNLLFQERRYVFNMATVHGDMVVWALLSLFQIYILFVPLLRMEIRCHSAGLCCRRGTGANFTMLSVIIILSCDWNNDLFFRQLES